MSKSYSANPEMLDPDVRFLLANERTLLAWVRTGLALIAGGLALTQFAQGVLGRVGLGILAILFGAAMTIIGYSRYKAADQAIRHARLPKKGKGPLIQVGAVIIFALSVVVFEIARIL